MKVAKWIDPMEEKTKDAKIQEAIEILADPTTEKSGKFSLTLLDEITSKLSLPMAKNTVDAEVALALLSEIGRYQYNEGDQFERLRYRVVYHVQSRWAELSPAIARHVVENWPVSDLFELFPDLGSDPTLIRLIATAIANDSLYDFSLRDLCQKIRPTKLDDARLLIHAMFRKLNWTSLSKAQWQKDQLANLFSAIARGLGWTPWVRLFTILLAAPEYADPLGNTNHESDPSKQPMQTITAWQDIARHIIVDDKINPMAMHLLGLIGPEQLGQPLLDRPAETRAAFVATLVEICALQDDVRHAAIEALLWLARHKAMDLAQFAAVRLLRGDDIKFLKELSRHPESNVGYAALGIAATAGLAPSLMMPAHANDLPTVVALTTKIGTREHTASPRTWLGDRTAEDLIEQTVWGVERRFGSEYELHGEDGEDRLLAMMFSTLSASFDALDKAFEATARALGASRRSTISVRYRSVDRSEEGKPGVRGASRFAADLCLIVDPTLDSRSLGRRVTLVQAKRLYRDSHSPKQPAWHNSFHLDVKQLDELIKQTRSAVYFFQSPLEQGRGVPVIPARLVADLAAHQSGSGAELARATVTKASRSLADWFTYDLVALRTGDPLEALVKKAEGKPGGLPRRLLQLPRVEIEVGVTAVREGSRRAHDY